MKKNYFISEIENNFKNIDKNKIEKEVTLIKKKKKKKKIIKARKKNKKTK